MTRARRQEKQQGRVEATRPTDELAEAQFPRRTGPAIGMDRLLGLYERYLKLHPEQSEALLARVQELTKRYRPLGTERVLRTVDASRFTKLSRARLRQLAAEGTFGELVDGQWRYSEAELGAYMQLPRLQGPRRQT